MNIASILSAIAVFASSPEPNPNRFIFEGDTIVYNYAYIENCTDMDNGDNIGWLAAFTVKPFDLDAFMVFNYEPRTFRANFPLCYNGLAIDLGQHLYHKESPTDRWTWCFTFYATPFYRDEEGYEVYCVSENNYWGYNEPACGTMKYNIDGNHIIFDLTATFQDNKTVIIHYDGEAIDVTNYENVHLY